MRLLDLPDRTTRGPESPRWLRVALLALAVSPQLAAQSHHVPGPPAWLVERVATFMAAPLGTMPTEVWTFERESRAVYYVRGSRIEELLDSAGDVVCRVDAPQPRTTAEPRPCTAGDFATSEMHLVWQDPRIGLRPADQSTER
jgi:hypothetical protein